MDLACSCSHFFRRRCTTSIASFAFRSSSVFGTGILFGDAFSKEEEIPKRISEKNPSLKGLTILFRNDALAVALDGRLGCIQGDQAGAQER